MKRHGIVILLAAAVAGAGCSPNFISGKTQCSDKKECPSGFSCSDNGTSGIHYCVDNKEIGCSSGSTFYCSQTKPPTCWPRPGACSTVSYCGTAKHSGYVICPLPNYLPDCNSDSCLPVSTVGDASPGSGGRDGGAGGAVGTGGAIAKGGAGGATITSTGRGGAPGYGGSIGYGGVIGYGGSIGAGGVRDAGPEAAVVSTGGVRDAGPEVPGLGGAYLTGGAIGRGGTLGTGGLYLTGGSTGRGGTTGSGGIRGTGGSYGSGGSTGSTLCSGTPSSCGSYSTASYCALGSGCAWNDSTSTCIGTVLPCNANTSSTSCIYNGCTWSGPLTCSPTPITPECSSGMSSSTDACDVCIFSSCCGQMTACINDTTCSSSLAGPLWNKYLDCVINCCGSASACDWY
jgi:hypothetical protein